MTLLFLIVTGTIFLECKLLMKVVDVRQSFQVKRKSIPRLLQLTYAHKRKQAKDEKRLDGLHRIIGAKYDVSTYGRAQSMRFTIQISTHK
jgi:hypothetical protein